MNKKQNEISYLVIHIKITNMRKIIFTVMLFGFCCNVNGQTVQEKIIISQIKGYESTRSYEDLMRNVNQDTKILSKERWHAVQMIESTESMIIRGKEIKAYRLSVLYHREVLIKPKEEN